MDEPNDILGPESDGEQLAETTHSLGRERPVPSPAFRGELGRLLALAKLVRPVAHPRAKALALAIAAALLLGVAGAGVAGSGPLAPTHVTKAPRRRLEEALDRDAQLPAVKKALAARAEQAAANEGKLTHLPARASRSPKSAD